MRLLLNSKIHHNVSGVHVSRGPRVLVSSPQGLKMHPRLWYVNSGQFEINLEHL